METITDLDVVIEYCLWGMKEAMENDDFEEMLCWARPCLEEFYDLDLDETIKDYGWTLETLETECRKRNLKDMMEHWKLQKRRGRVG